MLATNSPLEQAHEGEKRTRVEAMGLRDLGRLTLVYFDERDGMTGGQRHLRFYGGLGKVSNQQRKKDKNSGKEIEGT